MKKGLLFLALSIIMTSCLTIKIYKMSPESKVEPENPIRKKTALISSGMIASLKDGDSEIFFFGEDPELNYFQHKKEGDTLVHSSKKTFIFKGSDSDEAIQWITKQSDTLNPEKIQAFEYSTQSNLTGEDIFISDDNKEVKINISSHELKPIIIIDGKEMEPGFDVSAISVDSIESIDVLKGPKAIEKMGEKGKNGVILIKMKKEE